MGWGAILEVHPNAGVVPLFYSKIMKTKKILKCYVDESGDFGRFDPKSPLYVVSFVMVSSEDDAEPYIRLFKRRLRSKECGEYPIHVGPLIRREDPYGDLERPARLELFEIAWDLLNLSPARVLNIAVKKEGGDPMMAIAKAVAKAIYEHLGFFRSFDEVVVFYDNGQAQLKTMLLSIFSANFLNFSMELAKQGETPFLQAADMAATLALLEYKVRESNLSASESYFFAGRRILKKVYLPILRIKSI